MSDIKKETIHLADLYPTMQKVIEAGGEFLFYPSGRSMLPTIKPGRDGVLLQRASKPSARDLLLYRRKDGSFVLHRLVRIEKNGSLVMRGDAQYIDEKGILPEQIVGRVCAIVRNEKQIRTDSPAFRLRACVREISYPLRRFVHRLKGKISRTVRRKK